MRQANFEQYEMYNDIAEMVEFYERATFVRLHNSEEAKNFVLDLYRYYHDEEVHFDGIDIDLDGVTLYHKDTWCGVATFTAVTDDYMQDKKRANERHAEKIRFLKEQERKWDEEHKD